MGPSIVEIIRGAPLDVFEVPHCKRPRQDVSENQPPPKRQRLSGSFSPSPDVSDRLPVKDLLRQAHDPGHKRNI